MEKDLKQTFLTPNAKLAPAMPRFEVQDEQLISLGLEQKMLQTLDARKRLFSQRDLISNLGIATLFLFLFFVLS